MLRFRICARALRASEGSVGELMAQERVRDAPGVRAAMVWTCHPWHSRSYARRPALRKGAWPLPEVYAYEILAQLR